MEEVKIWQRTMTASMIFLLFYGAMQYIIIKSLEPVSLLVGTVAFWLVLFIIQKAMTKHLG